MTPIELIKKALERRYIMAVQRHLISKHSLYKKHLHFSGQWWRTDNINADNRTIVSIADTGQQQCGPCVNLIP